MWNEKSTCENGNNMGPLNVSLFHIEELEMTSGLAAESVSPVSVHFLTAVRQKSDVAAIPV